MNTPNISSRQLNYLMRTHFIFSGSFTIWFLVCTPQALFNIFIANYLTGSQAALGILVSAISFSAVFHIVSALISNMVNNQKWFWIVTTLIQRSITMSLAVVALLATREELRYELYLFLLSAMILSSAIGNMGGAFWWSWMSQIIPAKMRGRFFGRRAFASGIVNAVTVFSVFFILDLSAPPQIFRIFAIIFAIASIMGIINVLLHVRIPGPVQTTSPKPQSRLENLTIPFKNHNYRRFLLGTGILLFAVNFTGPFIAPYLVSEQGGQIPAIWIGIQFVVRQLLWSASTRLWGKLMDRFGGKSVVVVGILFFTYWLGFFFLTPHNYPVVLILQAIVAGIFGPAIFEGLAPWMLSIAPEDKKLTYSSWFWCIHGLTMALGSLLGGFSLRFLDTASWSFLPENNFIVLVICSLILIALAAIIFLSVKEHGGKPVAFLMQRISNPGIFRSLITIGIIERASTSHSVSRTLTRIQNESADIALEEIIDRLYDPDAEVRYEAVRALGRIRSEEAIEALSTELKNPHSSLRTQAARALGKIGNLASRELLETHSQSPPPGLQTASLSALGSLGDPRSLPVLRKVLSSTRDPQIMVTAALSASYLGEIREMQRVIHLLPRCTSPVQINEISLSIGNALGVPHGFYRYVSGSSETKDKRLTALLTEVQQNLMVISQTLARPLLQKREDFITTLQKSLEKNDAEEMLGIVIAMVQDIQESAASLPLSAQTKERFALCTELLQLQTHASLQFILTLLMLYFISSLRLP